MNLLALGDVGSTLAMGLRLMGGDVIASLGLCDVRPNVPERWEFELNQIGIPGAPDALPPVSVVDTDHLFDCDVFLFCASRFVPDTDVKTGDVRMAQYERTGSWRPSMAKWPGRSSSGDSSAWSATR